VETSQTSTPWYAESNRPEPPPGGPADGKAPVLQQASQKAGEVVDQARTQVMTKLDDQKERATGNLESVSQALRQTGQQLRDQDQGPFGQFAEGAADMVYRFSGYLNQRDIHQIVGEVESFARRQPALFLGGAFALGLIAARFLKSSGEGNGSMGYATAYQGSDRWAAQPYATAPASSYDTAAPGRAAGVAGSSIPITPVSDTPAVSVDADDEELVPAMGDRSSARLNDDA
jgi:hypothetical protein